MVRLQTLRFYRNSRDSWKQKHKEKQAHIKFLKIKIRDLAKSRDHWKTKAKELEAEIKKTSAAKYR